MAAGLQVWAPDGRQRIDTTTVTALLLGELSLGGNGTPQEGAIYDARFSQGDPFFVTIAQGLIDRDGANARLRFDGNYLRWTWPYADSGSPSTRPRSTILYGIR
ncbi:MAG TPA: hypothetical protein H9899_07535 [Candidatus Sphingomonas excrementigallinarum]|nr:hypothetical protein [Candidatus Sphingomonas excrementigallinarum]